MAVILDGRPVFLHTFWRSNGTYFWELFRRNPAFRAYVEPCHEALAWKTLADWQSDFDRGMVKALRHPDLKSHYFNEYPILGNGGVPLHHERFAFDRFILEPTDHDPELLIYLRFLIDYAASHGQIAAMKFCRFGLRTRYIARNIPAWNVFLCRPPEEIYASFVSFGPNSYFTRAPLVILRRNDHPRLKSLANFIGITPGPSGTLAEDFSKAGELLKSLPEMKIKLMVAAFWLLYLLENAEVADRIVDTQLLISDVVYRDETSSWFAPWLGPDAFKDFAVGPTQQSFTLTSGQQWHSLAHDLLRDCDRETLSRVLAGVPLGESCRQLLETIL
ncbi:MAG: hypothetical protein Q8M03_10860 [Legionella sp.]|nr:hypothetical protein [Legionella sp.]